MSSRLVVTTSRGATSSVAIDKHIQPNPFASLPGFDHTLLWGTQPAPSVPWDGRNVATEHKSLLPEPGGTRLMLVTYLPDSAMAAPGFDPTDAGAEYLERLPGLAELFEPNNPGMHTTDSVDYVIIVDGEIWLELDDGKTGPFQRGDIAVQRGTPGGIGETRQQSWSSYLSALNARSGSEAWRRTLRLSQVSQPEYAPLPDLARKAEVESYLQTISAHQHKQAVQ